MIVITVEDVRCPKHRERSLRAMQDRHVQDTYAQTNQPLSDLDPRQPSS
jgi:hypothetical protein